jgi:hypothetical protein
VSWLHLDIRGASISAAALFVLATAVRPWPRRWAGWVSSAAYESGLVCALFALWQVANRVTHTAHSGGLDHGLAVWHAERWLHLPSETALQRLFIHQTWLVGASNYYYETAHLTGMVVFLVWLWLRHRDRYARWRNVVALFTGLALLIEMIPVAPPRLLPHTGLVDTAMVYGQSVYAFVGSDLADQYAALPSIHVGWAVLIGVAVWKCSNGVWRSVGVVHAVLTIFVVVVTANHYWLDAVTATAVLVLAMAAEQGARMVISSRVRSLDAGRVSDRCYTYPATSGRATADR